MPRYKFRVPARGSRDPKKLTSVRIPKERSMQHIIINAPNENKAKRLAFKQNKQAYLFIGEVDSNDRVIKRRK